MPVESAISTRNPSRPDSQTGSARNGLLAILSSVSCVHAARAGGSAPRKLAEISRARSVDAMLGRVCVKSCGSELGVARDARRRCVVPVRGHQHMDTVNV